jgi:hypothetical protein
LNDKRHGQGKLISAKGERTEGNWVQDQLEGPCVIYLTGTKKRFYSGSYQSSKKVGTWSMWEENNGKKIRLQNEDWTDGIL